MRWMPAVLVVCAVAAALPSCRSAADKEARREEKRLADEAKREEKRRSQAATWEQKKAAIPADSPLAKIEYGMDESQVIALLGSPTSTGGHVTGQAFNPFNVSSRDTYRVVYYYKGMGRISFSHGGWGQRNGVVDLAADANEPGYQPQKQR